MDNYSLEEVKNIIEKNLMTPDVLKNILKSSTRRVETYQDSEAVSILKYLSLNESIPHEIKDEINKYLAQYDNYNVQNTIENDEKTAKRKNNIIILFILIFILFVIALFVIHSS